MSGAVGFAIGFVKDSKRFLNRCGSENRILTVSDLTHCCVKGAELQYNSMAVQSVERVRRDLHLRICFESNILVGPDKTRVTTPKGWPNFLGVRVVIEVDNRGGHESNRIAIGTRTRRGARPLGLLA